jgi:RHS repeat-associated protein
MLWFASILEAASLDLEHPVTELGIHLSTGQIEETVALVTLAGPAPAALVVTNVDPDGQGVVGRGWKLKVISTLTPEDTFRKGGLQLKTEYDVVGRLLFVKITNADGTKVFNHAKVNYFLDKVEIDTQDGQHAVMKYLSAREPRITEIVTSANQKTVYHYQEGKLVWKEKADNDYLIYAYDDQGRVILQKAPWGPAGEEAEIAHYEYAPTHVRVADASGQMTAYQINHHQHLEQSITYVDGHAYRTEQFYWSAPYPDGKPRLLTRVLKDAADQILIAQTYRYDAQGSQVQETTWGNISGSSAQRVEIGQDGNILTHDAEHYSTYTTYSDDQAHRVIKTAEDNGKTILWGYDAQTGLLISKITCMGTDVLFREGYEYNADGLLVNTFTDDGQSLSILDSSGVTEKQIVTQEPNLKGMPETILTKYVDHASKAEVVLQTSINTYSVGNELIQQEVADQDGMIRRSILSHYDQNGRINFIEDSLNVRSSIEYNEAGDVKWEFDQSSNIQRQYTYDAVHRVIGIKETASDGTVSEWKKIYDNQGNLTIEIDPYGQSTRHYYDGLKRLVRTVYPEAPDGEGKLIHAEVTFEYDAQDRLTSSTDARGYTTHFEYNLKGDVTRIHYPDGTVEVYVYNPDGSLAKEVAKNGTQTVYTCDCLNRVTKVEVLSAAGELLKTETCTYTAFHKAEQTDSSGRTSHYRFDGAGRLSEALLNTPDGISQHTYHYDALGMLREVKANQQFSLITERNVDNQVVRHQVKNKDGKLIISASQQHLPETDSKKTVNRDQAFVNEHGQTVLQITEVEVDGMATVTTYDTLQRVASVVLKNSLGQILSECQMRYDAAGNKVWQKELVIGKEGAIRGEFILTWRYGPLNRLESVSETGEHLTKTMAYGYSAYGELATLIKPDGVTLNYTYDALGRIVSLTSSDRTIDFAYTYDKEDRVVSVKDLVNGHETVRTYDWLGRQIKEKLANGLSIRSEFDVEGRRLKMILPDHSSVKYEYDAMLLKAIHRIDSSGSTRYSHLYKGYDLSGQLHQVQMIGKAGELRLTWDQKGKLNGIVTKHWSQSISDSNDKGLPTLMTTADPVGISTTHYQFDERGQLLTEEGPQSVTYEHDSLHNRIHKDGQPYQVNGLNQLVEAKGENYTYDPSGNLIYQSAKNIHYQYDALNRLIEAVCEKKWKAEYAYDPFHRRIAKTFSTWNIEKAAWNKPLKTHYLYDGELEIGSTSSDGVLKELRLLGTGVGAELGASVAIEIDHKPYAPVHDLRGSIRCLIDADTGKPAEIYRQTAFGETVAYKGTGQEIDSQECLNPWRYSSKRVDAETGFSFFGRRYYAPELGRWISPDPLGYADHTNLYAYVHNNPLCYADYDGLFSVSAAWGTISDTLHHIYNAASNRVKNHFKDMYNFKPWRHITNKFESIGRWYLGDTLFNISGYYREQPFSGVYGHGEMYDKKRITFINGILNNRDFMLENLQMISNAHGGNNVHFTYRATSGWVKDFLTSTLIKLGYVSSDARRLAQMWKGLIHDMGGTQGGGIIIHYAHSIGGTETLMAKRYMTLDEQRMIHVVTFGSATMVPEGGFRSVINIVSVRDGVCYLDPWRYAMGALGIQKNVIFIGSMRDGAPLVDHSLCNYWRFWRSNYFEDYYRDLDKRGLRV